MKNILISIDYGHILLGGIKIAPISLTEFRGTMLASDVKYSECTPTIGWTNIGIDVSLVGHDFGMNLSYHEDSLQLCWFAWDGGVAASKGYATSEGELISDKNSLTKIVGEAISRTPDKKNYNNDVFFFNWGYISTSASIKSATVSIGIAWTKEIHPV